MCYAEYMMRAMADDHIVRADAHMHLFDGGLPGPLNRPPAGPDELGGYQALRGGYGIVCALAIGVENVPLRSGNNAYLAGLAADHRWLAPVHYLPTWPPPEGVRLDEILQRLVGPYVGVSFWVLDDDAADQLAAWPEATVTAIGGAATVVSVNGRAPVISTISRFVTALAPATVLFSHLGLPGRRESPVDRETVRAMMAPLLALADESHIGVKVSGYYATTEPRHAYPHYTALLVTELIVRYGADRMFWGSDYSAALNWVSFAQVANPLLPDDISDEERAAIFGQNLLRVLGRTVTIGSEVA